MKETHPIKASKKMSSDSVLLAFFDPPILDP